MEVDWDAIWDMRDIARCADVPTETSDSTCAHTNICMDQRENNVTCTDCGLVLESGHVESLGWRDGVQMLSKSVYKRRHHFKERVLQFMGMDRYVPKRVLDAARASITPPVTKTKIRAYLRTTKNQKFIENWIQIYCYVTGTPSPGVVMRPEEVEWLYSMFLHIENAFNHVKPVHRKSMLNYNFLFVRLLQIIGRKELIQWFPQLKSRAKTKQLDAIWQDICVHTQLPFLPLPTVKALR